MKNAGLLQSQKEHILSELHQVRTEIISAVQQLPPVQRSEIFLGTWSVEDCLAHLVGWDYTNIEAAKAIQNGLLPEFYAHRDKDWQGYNAILVNKYKLKRLGRTDRVGSHFSSTPKQLFRATPSRNLLQGLWGAL